jgi:hypothetical protein
LNRERSKELLIGVLGVSRPQSGFRKVSEKIAQLERLLKSRCGARSPVEIRGDRGDALRRISRLHVLDDDSMALHARTEVWR